MLELGNVQRVVVAIVGAIIFTTASIGAAAWPAQTAGSVSTAYASAQTTVEAARG